MITTLSCPTCSDHIEAGALLLHQELTHPGELQLITPGPSDPPVML